MFFSSKIFGWHYQLVTMGWRCCRMCVVAFSNFIMTSKNYTWSREPPDERLWKRIKDYMLSSCHLYVFQSESTLYSYQNVKELLARRRHKIWSLEDYKWTRTNNHLVHKRTLNHLASGWSPLAVIRFINFHWNHLNLTTPSFQCISELLSCKAGPEYHVNK